VLGITEVEIAEQQGGVIPGGVAVSYPPGEEAWTE
jgi:hypothetical protein